MAPLAVIVDDSLTVRMDLKRAFDAGGFRTSLCGTGGEARAALAAGPVDVVVLDVRLPDADGVDLLRELRAEPAHQDTVVVMLSSEAEVADRVRALRSGADEYVGKPYDAGRVVARTRQLLRSRSAPAREEAAVLVIDDSLTFREDLRRALEKAGYPVYTAASGEEGLRLAADRLPQAIIVDGVMPGIDGATVIRSVRMDPALRDVPCLLLTAADDHSAELAALDAGADAFVRKHGDQSLVLATLAAVLRKSADTRPLETAGSVHRPTTVLVVDGDRDRLHDVGDAMRAAGHDVVLADRVGDAAALLANQHVDCVVIDLELAGRDCADVVRRLRAAVSRGDVPVVVVGARADPRALLDCAGSGVDQYLRWSDGLEMLSAHVRSQVRRRRTQDESRRVRERLLRGQLEVAKAQAARELAEARAALVEELEWRNRELDAFTESVSHDLRGPLQVLLAFSEELLEEEAGRLSGTGQHRLQRISSAARRMSELVDSLLLLSRAGRADLDRQPTDLSAIANEIVAELANREPDRAVDVTVHDGLIVQGDPGLLRVVMENLIGNSWKFSRRVERPAVEVGRAVAGPDVGVFVRDNGAGFPAADADRLFRPFQRLHGQKDFPGTGVGLATVKRIIDRHGGRIWAASEPGRGAEFTFVVPSAPPLVSSSK